MNSFCAVTKVPHICLCLRTGSQPACECQQLHHSVDCIHVREIPLTAAGSASNLQTDAWQHAKAKRSRWVLTACFRLSAEAVAAAAMTPPEAAALPGGSAAQRENLKKAQQKQREGAIWRQTASCICANLSVYWRREGADFPSTPTAGLHTSSLRSCILIVFTILSRHEHGAAAGLLQGKNAVTCIVPV